MASLNASHLLQTHLGQDAHRSGLVSSRVFRSVCVSRMRPLPGEWTWAPPEGSAAFAALVIAAEGHTVSAGDGAPTRALFLPPVGSATIVWSEPADLIAVWLPPDAVSEFANTLAPVPSALPNSPFLTAISAFATSLSGAAKDSSGVARYAIERLLVEMAFGALLERHSSDHLTVAAAPLIERARSVMMARREDAGFTAAQLSQDLHVSARQLQRAFAREMTTPVIALRRMRVELAESLLRNPHYDTLSIDEIARHSGFTSALQLRRALGAEHLPPPSALRAGHG
ncbi:helix-turn-helix domain-containing protein [Microbacterium aurantiacum]|uniref:helix-turn-helix domain-containing protein n=1 Tax=Microbacterium aurantiacum TaxID=162393 RepID=UPI000C80F459|nr:helix-turn-helix domain-containing protein [Microbacterium aurantiacum]